MISCAKKPVEIQLIPKENFEKSITKAGANEKTKRNS